MTSPVKHNANAKFGICGKIKFVDAAIAPMSTPMFIVFAIKRSDVIGKTTLFENCFFNALPKPTPVTSPIRAHFLNYNHYRI